MAEFRGLVARVDELEASLAVAAQGIGASDDAAEEPLRALDSAKQTIVEVTPRAEVFEKRAKETDPDKKIYGPQMVQKVLALCERLIGATEHAEELEEALAPLRERFEAATRAAQEQAAALAAAKQADEERRHREEQEAAAAAAAAAAARESEQAATVSIRRVVQTEDEMMGRRPLVSGLSLADALGLLQRSCSEQQALADALQALHLLCANVVAVLPTCSHPLKPSLAPGRRPGSVTDAGTSPPASVRLTGNAPPTRGSIRTTRAFVQYGCSTLNLRRWSAVTRAGWRRWWRLASASGRRWSRRRRRFITSSRCAEHEAGSTSLLDTLVCVYVEE